MAGGPYGFQPTAGGVTIPFRTRIAVNIFMQGFRSGAPSLLNNRDLWANPRSGQRGITLRNTLQTAATRLAEILGVDG
eukprot:11036277-Alexandrium_andersonii.AAC.1